MAYNALILLPSDTDATLEAARRRLEDFYAGDEGDITFEAGENKLTMTIDDDWSCYINLNSKPHVVEESKEMAEKLPADRPDREQIASSGVRFEVSTDDDDEDMSYFNDYVLVIEQLGKIPGAKVFDSAAGEFMN